MKALLLVLAVTLSCAACRKEQDMTPMSVAESIDTAAIIKYYGKFESGPYGKVLGEVRIYKQKNKYMLRLENFKSSNGPNLHVLLSKEEKPVNFNDLGKLKSLGGSQVYEIPENLDEMPYRYVCIHCVDFNHLFGFAKL